MPVKFSEATQSALIKIEDSPCKQINNNIKINQHLLSASSKCQSQGQYDDESAFIHTYIYLCLYLGNNYCGTLRRVPKTYFS